MHRIYRVELTTPITDPKRCQWLKDMLRDSVDNAFVTTHFTCGDSFLMTTRSDFEAHRLQNLLKDYGIETRIVQAKRGDKPDSDMTVVDATRFSALRTEQPVKNRVSHQARWFLVGFIIVALLLLVMLWR